MGGHAMASKLTVGILLLLGLLLLVLWAPWLTPQYAERRVMEAFTTAWQGVSDGCGFNCRGCGVQKLQRVLGGHIAHIEYACGLLPEDSVTFHKTGRVYVSFVGTLHGLPTP